VSSNNQRCGSRRHGGEDFVIALADSLHELGSFEILGTSMGVEVHAAWDGRWLTLSPLLFQVAELSMEVERTFAEIGVGSRWPSFRDGPELVAVEILRSLDAVTSVEQTGSRQTSELAASRLLERDASPPPSTDS
jgi:hypothetical protein